MVAARASAGRPGGGADSAIPPPWIGERPHRVSGWRRSAGLELDPSSAASVGEQAVDPAGDRGEARRGQQLRADRCPALASLLVGPARRPPGDRTSGPRHPGSDGGQLGPPRSDLGQQAVRPGRRLATRCGASRRRASSARPASSTASRSTSSNHRSHSLRSPGGASSKALSRRRSSPPCSAAKHERVGQAFDHRRAQYRALRPSPTAPA